MPELPAILTAALTGFLSGFLLSIPVGPVNLSIMNEGALRGFRYAALIGLGASIMEVIYCSVAFTGFSNFFQQDYIKHTLEVFSFAFIVFLGIRLVMVTSIQVTSKMGERVEDKFHPHSAFMTGFVRVLGNPNVLLFWIVLSANFISRDWVQPSMAGKGACVLGVALGTNAWFSGLSYAIARKRQKLGDKALLWMQRVSGLVLLVFAFAHGIHIAWKMHHKK